MRNGEKREEKNYDEKQEEKRDAYNPCVGQHGHFSSTGRNPLSGMALFANIIVSYNVFFIKVVFPYMYSN